MEYIFCVRMHWNQSNVNIRSLFDSWICFVSCVWICFIHNYIRKCSRILWQCKWCVCVSDYLILCTRNVQIAECKIECSAIECKKIYIAFITFYLLMLRLCIMWVDVSVCSRLFSSYFLFFSSCLSASYCVCHLIDWFLFVLKFVHILENSTR